MAEQELSAQAKQELKGQERTRPGRSYIPAVDICETPEALWLWADMPGVDERSIEINLADGVLSIEGHVAVEDYKSLTPVYTEYNIGDYLRRFTLQGEIDVDRIQARMKNGVLMLELPKAEHAKPRRIQVSVQ